MNIGYRGYVTEYIDFIDNISNIIDVSLYNNMELSINEMINAILLYVHENFPAILISKEELSEKVKSIYVQKTEIFKKNIEFRKASTKYDLNGSFSLPKIKEIMEKGNKDLQICLKSLSYGTNISYIDTVINISSDIFGTIQRSCNNNLMFAKKTRETQEFIEKTVLAYYCKLMKLFGEELNNKIINTLESIYNKINNYVEPSNNKIINDYIDDIIEEEEIIDYPSFGKLVA